MKQHTVKAGDCVASIAALYGFTVDLVWDLPENASLKEKRKDPNTLVPGDVVSVPDRREKVVSCETAKIHKFKLSAPSAVFRAQLFEDEKPLASQAFELKIEGETYSGTTDAQGSLEVAIPPNSRVGTLTVGTEPKVKAFELQFGELQPIGEDEGLEARLRNLGFVERKIEDALRSFQRRFGIEETGQADQATKDKLTEIHDTVCEYPE
jgi:murein DD-endopeptidase MepM/ murein hydrolase activator NlpD